jgi:hypothetical protein
VSFLVGPRCWWWVRGRWGWRLPLRWSGMAMTSRWLIGKRQGRIPRALITEELLNAVPRSKNSAWGGFAPIQHTSASLALNENYECPKRLRC